MPTIDLLDLTLIRMHAPRLGSSLAVDDPPLPKWPSRFSSPIQDQTRWVIHDDALWARWMTTLHGTLSCPSSPLAELEHPTLDRSSTIRDQASLKERRTRVTSARVRQRESLLPGWAAASRREWTEQDRGKEMCCGYKTLQT
jgi:hypothetical protein